MCVARSGILPFNLVVTTINGWIVLCVTFIKCVNFYYLGVIVVTAVFLHCPSIHQYHQYHLLKQQVHTQNPAAITSQLQYPLITQLVAGCSGQTQCRCQTSVLTFWWLMTSIVSHPPNFCRRHLSWWMVEQIFVNAQHVVVQLGIGKELKVQNRCDTLAISRLRN